MFRFFHSNSPNNATYNDHRATTKVGREA